jgi:hypothetical protein
VGDEVVIALIRSAMCDFMPATERLPGIADTGVTEFLHTMKRESGKVYWLGLVMGAWIYALTPLLTVYVPLPSFVLPAALRDRHASRILQSRFYLIRQAVFLVRLSAGLCWGRDPRVRQQLGLAAYAPDPGSYRTT